MVQQTGARLSKYKRLEQSSVFKTRVNFGSNYLNMDQGKGWFRYPEKGSVKGTGEGFG